MNKPIFNVPLKKNEENSHLSDFFVFFAWLGLFFLCLKQHVPWRDEWQSWLVSIRTQSWSEFFNAVRYERQPPLLYLLLRFLYWITGSPESWVFQSLTATFSVGSTALILFGFELKKWMKYLVVFGILFIFDYGVVSRCYALGVFLLLAFLGLKQRRMWTAARLALVLLSFVHLYFTGIAGALYSLWVYDRLKQGSSLFLELKKGFWVFLALVLSLWTQRPPLDSSFGSGLGSVLSFQADAVVRAMAHGMLGLDGWVGPFRWNAHPWNTGSALVVLLGLFIPMARMGFSFRRFLWVLLSPLYVMGSVYHASLRHAGVVYLTWLAFVFEGSSKLKRSVWVAIPGVLMVFASARWLSSWKPWQPLPEYDLSGSGEVLREFKPRFSAERSALVVLADEDWEEAIFFPVSGVLGVPVYSARRHKFLAYPFFSTREYQGSVSDWCRKWGSHLGGLFPGQKIYFARYKGRVPPEGCSWSAKVFESSRPVLTEEIYSVYSAQ